MANKIVLADDNDFLLFDVNRAQELRTNPYRLCGRFIGSSIASSHSSGNDTAIPFKLNRQEVQLLVDMDQAVVKRLSLNKASSFEQQDSARVYKQYKMSLQETNEKQRVQLKSQRRRQMEALRDKILKGRRDKLTKRLAASSNDQLLSESLRSELDNLEANFELELQKLDNEMKNESGAAAIGATSHYVELPIHMPDYYQLAYEVSDLTSRFGSTDKESCKQMAFRYFWSKGNYLSNGTKFGGHFLVYSGNPSQYHAKFILVCLETLDEYAALTLKQIITYARMATSVKKTFLLALPIEKMRDDLRFADHSNRLAELNDNGQLHFISLNWSHM